MMSIILFFLTVFWGIGGAIAFYQSLARVESAGSARFTLCVLAAGPFVWLLTAFLILVGVVSLLIQGPHWLVGKICDWAGKERK